MKQLYAIWKPKQMTKKEISIVGSASPILGYNKNYSGKRQKAWEYDLKSAYSWGMLQDLPDVDGEMRENSELNNDEIGFNVFIREDGQRVLQTAFAAGTYCRWIFKKKSSPYKPFVMKYYKAKENAKTKKEKSIAKAYLNVVIGQLHILSY